MRSEYVNISTNNYDILDKYTKDELENIKLRITVPVYEKNYESRYYPLCGKQIKKYEMLEYIKERQIKIKWLKLEYFEDDIATIPDEPYRDDKIEEIIEIIGSHPVEKVSLSHCKIMEKHFNRLMSFIHSKQSIVELDISCLAIRDIDTSVKFEVVKSSHIKNITMRSYCSSDERWDGIFKYVFIEDLKNTLEHMEINTVSKELLSRMSCFFPKSLYLNSYPCELLETLKNVEHLTININKKHVDEFKKFLSGGKRIKTMYVSTDHPNIIVDAIINSDVVIEYFEITSCFGCDKKTEELLKVSIEKGKILRTRELATSDYDFSITDENYKSIITYLKNNHLRNVSVIIDDEKTSDFSKVEEVLLNLPESIESMYVCYVGRVFKYKSGEFFNALSATKVPCITISCNFCETDHDALFKFLGKKSLRRIDIHGIYGADKKKTVQYIKDKGIILEDLRIVSGGGNEEYFGTLSYENNEDLKLWTMLNKIGSGMNKISCTS